MGEWISVEDRLPEKPMNYLIYVPPCYVNVVYYNGFEWAVDVSEYYFNGGSESNDRFLVVH